MPRDPSKIQRTPLASAASLRVGFVPLLDAAPLIAAFELGYFADEGLDVTLERQIGWGNVRDKLSYGHLSASHALLGMPVLSAMRSERFIEPLVAIVALGGARNAITLSRRLAGSGSKTTFPPLSARRDALRPLVLAHVFGCSVHHYLLRDWLASGGMDLDRDVRLIVLPPPQMNGQMLAGTIDGFCAGEPWNTLAEADGIGQVVASGSSLMPGHPDKVLAVTSRWLAANGAAAVALVRATLRGWQFCRTPGGRSTLAEMLARPKYLNLNENLVARSLSSMATESDDTITIPAAAQAVWLLQQMARWGHVTETASDELSKIARAAVDEGPYCRAMEGPTPAASIAASKLRRITVAAKE